MWLRVCALFREFESMHHKINKPSGEIRLKLAGPPKSHITVWLWAYIYVNMHSHCIHTDVGIHITTSSNGWTKPDDFLGLYSEFPWHHRKSKIPFACSINNGNERCSYPTFFVDTISAQCVTCDVDDRRLLALHRCHSFNPITYFLLTHFSQYELVLVLIVFVLLLLLLLSFYSVVCVHTHKANEYIFNTGNVLHIACKDYAIKYMCEMENEIDKVKSVGFY